VPKANIRQAAISEVIRLLRKERESQKMSMNQLAEHSGLSQSMISLLERGIRNPTLETLLRIADVLKVDLAKIIGQAIRTAAKGKSK
jgi:transcriptional regulator with XRE-family HTH domain